MKPASCVSEKGRKKSEHDAKNQFAKITNIV